LIHRSKSLCRERFHKEKKAWQGQVAENLARNRARNQKPLDNGKKIGRSPVSYGNRADILQGRPAELLTENQVTNSNVPMGVAPLFHTVPQMFARPF
jgi:hypothetical protein